jgi:hypothetical protein
LKRPFPDLVRDIDFYLAGFSVLSACHDVATILQVSIREALGTPTVRGGIHPMICPGEGIDVADTCCIIGGEEEELHTGDG